MRTHSLRLHPRRALAETLPDRAVLQARGDRPPEDVQGAPGPARHAGDAPGARLDRVRVLRRQTLVAVLSRDPLRELDAVLGWACQLVLGPCEPDVGVYAL